MIARFRAISLTGLTILLCVLQGCGPSESPEVVRLRKQFQLAEPPSEVVSVKKVRKQLLAEDAPSEVDVVLRGRIHAGELPPWEPGKAAFVLTDATGHEGEDDHDPHTCPFCSRRINDYLAKVSFYDGADVASVDARTLFDVAEKQLVYVIGKASIDDDDLLKVRATGIYVVR